MCKKFIGFYTVCLSKTAGPSSCQRERLIGTYACEDSKKAGEPCSKPEQLRVKFLTGCCSSRCERSHRPSDFINRLRDPNGYDILQDRDIAKGAGGWLVDVGELIVVGRIDEQDQTLHVKSVEHLAGRTNLTAEEQAKYCQVQDRD